MLVGDNFVPGPATIVICAYTEDRWDTFRRSVGEAAKQMTFEDELLVVIDHNDSLLARCRESLEHCRVFANQYGRGLSGSRNTALAEAQGSMIVFLDDDAVPLDGWLDSLRAQYVAGHVYGVGGRAMPHWLGGRPKWFPDEFLWVVGCSYRGLPATAGPVRNLIGANMSFRKAAFDDVGGFVETLGRVGDVPLGCEETEFCIRLRAARPNVGIIYEPSSKVEHNIAVQRGSLRYFVRRCWAEGLSKVEVAQRAGRSSALSSEREYARRVLPAAMWQGARDAVGGDVWGAARSGVIGLGLLMTVAGYCYGTVRRVYPNAGKSRDAGAGG